MTMIPTAIIGWMHPVLAEIAMATSSTTVVTSANRLRKVDIRPDYLRETASPWWRLKAFASRLKVAA